jgi:hypothetical protein
VINNLWCEPIPLLECDFGMRCPHTPVAIVTTVDNETNSTVERRPFCEAHLQVKGMFAAPLDSTYKFQVHPILWIQRRQAA